MQLGDLRTAVLPTAEAAPVRALGARGGVARGAHGAFVAIVGARSARHTASTWRVTSPSAARWATGRWCPVVRTASTRRHIVVRSPPTERPSACSPAASTGSIPAGHAPMLRRILERGCLVGEPAPGCAPSRTRFLVRNRLIAALSRGTVVVEAAVRSGSLNTARWAADLGREVMGVPGPVTSAASRGVHELLRTRSALLVTAADEVVEHLSPSAPGSRRDESAGRPRTATPSSPGRCSTPYPCGTGVERVDRADSGAGPARGGPSAGVAGRSGVGRPPRRRPVGRCTDALATRR